MSATTARNLPTWESKQRNAGVQSPAVEIAESSSEEFDRVNTINLRGVWSCMKYELRQMRQQGSGAIVNCSSIGGLIGLPGRATYHASKQGVIGLTKSAALEYASRIKRSLPGKHRYSDGCRHAGERAGCYERNFEG